MSIIRQTANGDLDVSSGTLFLETDPSKETAQRLTNRFRLVQGEWFLDTREGVPYRTRVVGLKDVDIRTVRNLLVKVALSTPGVADIDTCDVTFDSAARRASAVIKVFSRTGQLIAGELGGAFVVEE